LLELKATAREYGKFRNSLDVVSTGKFRESFRVDLKLHGSARKVPRDLRNMRRSHPARTAPGRTEIDEHGNFAVANNFVEFLKLTSMGSAIAGTPQVVAEDERGPYPHPAIGGIFRS
jgi:hypothetical protein